MTDPVFSRLLILALSFALAITCLFSAFPHLDLVISGVFTDGHGHFLMVAHPALQMLNDVLRFAQNGFFAGCILILALRLLRLTPPFDPGPWCLLAFSYAVGPGLIVNGILKAWMGRARPLTITEFGGDKLFTPMLQISDQCSKNCSFSSGEVALNSTFAFAILVLIWPRLGPRMKPVAVLFGAGWIGLSMALRIGLGRHFMSDALFSIAVSALVVLAAYRLFILPRTARRTAVPSSPIPSAHLHR